MRTLGNILWHFPFFGFVNALTTFIVEIPVALVLAKSVGTYFNPVNKKCVPQVVADDIARKKYQK